MIGKLRPRLAIAGVVLALGCGDPGQEAGEIESYQQALNACDEMVPANRQIDGIPAYAQCAMFESGPIYSNNGVDTSATKMGSDWIRTQPSGGYQCTELAHRYWLFRWQVTWLPRGNAGSWCDTMPPASSGVVQSTTPMHGDLMVLAPGSCGADATTGHVTVVDVVDSATQKLTVVEQNRARRGSYMQSCAKCFLHVVANQNGVPPDAGTKPVADAGSDAGGARPIGPDAGGGAPPLTPRDGGSVVSDAGNGVDASTGVVDAGAPSLPQADTGVSPGSGTDAASLPPSQQPSTPSAD
ncbi:MAG TPA: CHAP domain-containing protein, partial [Polyangiales bacterium]